MKILSIVGARPQFIKVKPFIKEFRRQKIQHVLLHTGQHFDYKMSKLFFDELGISQPKYNLNCHQGSLTNQMAQMLIGLEKVLQKEKPDVVLVYGDTTSTLAGSLAAMRLGIRLGHVEAGLRSYRKDMPEEINRVLTDYLSTYLFCPTALAVANLKKEGVARGVYLVGDVMYDLFKEQAKKVEDGMLGSLKVTSKDYYLLTIHRAENTDNVDNLLSILNVVRRLLQQVVFPVHPRTNKTFSKIKGFKKDQYKNILFIDPVSYMDMLALQKNAIKVLTDSGGVQKEAFFLRVPCVTLRKETEWPETLKANWNIITGTSATKILSAIRKKPAKLNQPNPFGNGRAVENIVKILKREA